MADRLGPDHTDRRLSTTPCRAGMLTVSSSDTKACPSRNMGQIREGAPAIDAFGHRFCLIEDGMSSSFDTTLACDAPVARVIIAVGRNDR
jgi:hypothetical protein